MSIKNEMCEVVSSDYFHIGGALRTVTGVAAPTPLFDRPNLRPSTSLSMLLAFLLRRYQNILDCRRSNSKELFAEVLKEKEKANPRLNKYRMVRIDTKQYDILFDLGAEDQLLVRTWIYEIRDSCH